MVVRVLGDDSVFFFNDTAPTEIYTLSLHDALPISMPARRSAPSRRSATPRGAIPPPSPAVSSRSAATDRKSTRLNSSHRTISYAVFCLKKKRLNGEVKRVRDHL